MNNLKDIIERFYKKHGYIYDYSLVKYITANTYVKIICKLHGIFLQTPHAHLTGQGCPECGGNKKLNIEVFTNRSNKIHNYKYDYSKFIYINNSTKGIIICPIHGEFKQVPSNHLLGNGCRKCGTIITVNKQSGNIMLFIEMANKIHNYKYDYSKFIYIRNNIKGIIICPIHGEFKQDQIKHINGKCGCPKCGDIVTSLKLRGNIFSFIEKVKVIHNNKYDYSKYIYINSITKGIIICPIHGEFNQDPSHHLRGRGCPSCSDSTGEKIIRVYLVKYNIEFIPQKKFNDLINIKTNRKLSLDFFITKLNLVIEYDGEGHFYPVRFRGISQDLANKKFINTKIFDEIKNNYCKQNNIRLLRIPYTSIDNIESILKDNLGNINE